MLVTWSVLTGPQHRNTNMEQPIQMLGRFGDASSRHRSPPAARRERERGAELTNFLHSTVVDDGQIMRSAGPVDPL